MRLVAQDLPHPQLPAGIGAALGKPFSGGGKQSTLTPNSKYTTCRRWVDLPSAGPGSPCARLLRKIRR